MVTPHSGETDSLEVVVDLIMSIKYTNLIYDQENSHNGPTVKRGTDCGMDSPEVKVCFDLMPK